MRRTIVSIFAALAVVGFAQTATVVQPQLLNYVTDNGSTLKLTQEASQKLLQDVEGYIALQLN